MAKLNLDILDSFDALGYNSNIGEAADLDKIVTQGSLSGEFIKAVSWLSTELSDLLSLEEHVSAEHGVEDVNSFLVEVSSFLKEINCPYTGLYEGPLSQRLTKPDERRQLLDFLCTELQAARMIRATKPAVLASITANMTLNESNTASVLKGMLIALGFPKPPTNVTAKQLFDKVEAKLKEQLAKVQPHSFTASRSLFVGELSDSQWQTIEQLNENLKTEFKIRAETLLKRLDVTIQSFTWSDRVKQKENEVVQAFRPKRLLMTPESTTSIVDLLAAREDLSLVEKTCSSNVRTNTQTSLTKLLMGRVPDRGGRPTEIQAPPPEMPSWQQRSGPPAGGRGGGGPRGGRGGGPPQPQRQQQQGGRVQGAGWNQPQQFHGGGGGQQNFHGGAYQDGQHGYAGYQSQDQSYSRGRGGYGPRGGRY